MEAWNEFTCVLETDQSYLTWSLEKKRYHDRIPCFECAWNEGCERECRKWG
jgi:hypothetical protein